MNIHQNVVNYCIWLIPRMTFVLLFFLYAFYTSIFSASNKYIFIIREIIIKVITGIKSRVLEKKERNTNIYLLLRHLVIQ